MDFYQIKERSTKNGIIEVYPDFKVGRSKDLMVRGKAFYAIWDEEQKLWSTDEYDVQRLVDQDVREHKEKIQSRTDGIVHAKLMSDFSSKIWTEFRYYIAHISDNSHQLDEELTFSNTILTKKHYASKRLPYPLVTGPIESYELIMSTLYDEEERQKLEWAIGAVVTGEAKHIQKFIVLYGEFGSGKSTFINIMLKLFQGYYTTFEAKSLTASANQFATEVFKQNPLIAIQHDGDLSKIEDNSKLNSIISHEEMTMNEKYKPSYMSRINAFLFMATNRPVKITDAKSGIIRRLIDVKPSGRRITPHKYEAAMAHIDFELGGIATHCADVFNNMGKNYYNNYKPLDMIFKTDVFFNFVESNYYIFKDSEGVSLKQAYTMYKEYCDDALTGFKLPLHKFREELKNYFGGFDDVARIDGKQIRSYYTNFLTEKFSALAAIVEEKPLSLVLEHSDSLLDEQCGSCLAQYSNKYETPNVQWANVKTTLSKINTRKLHFVKIPENHIVIDFDIQDDDGKKSLEKNIEAASKWPPTYAEFSKSGQGIHLHYIYDGDVDLLSNIYEPHIEIKVFKGNSSLRRKLTKCNNIPIQTINSGLPLKGEKVINFEAVKSERVLRNLIEKNLRKEIHPGTKPSMDFINKILTDAYESGLHYDITDMRPRILAFANNSTNQSAACLKLVTEMPFRSAEPSPPGNDDSAEIAFYDVEVFPNLFVIDWKFRGKPHHVSLINPKPKDIEELLKLKLVGFNCRRYDNHILYAAYIGYNNEQLFQLSQKIINSSENAMFSEAYNISYTDIYDFSSIKQSLKKFEIDLGIHHLELGLPWEEPVDPSLWQKVADYCKNDVDASEAVFEERYQDFVARQILAELSNLTLNDTTQKHAERIMFGTDPNPQSKFVYTDLSEMFPGYKYERGRSLYRGEDPKEGGYVDATPGMYGNAALLDVASMHPNSGINLNIFGPYTHKLKELVDARIAIKHNDYASARKMLGGILEKYLIKEDPEEAGALSYALKIVINIIYGLTSAKFPNKFKDPRNVDNIVAKRGALFMIDLKHAVKEQGYTVAHIKTDSIKIPDATPEIIEFVMEFGRKYGYTFEHEATYDKFCLVNDAVYIAKYGWAAKSKLINTWTATGTQFKQPYVFKTLFSHEPLVFADFCETKTVKTSLYLDMNENLPDVTMYEKELEERIKDEKDNVPISRMTANRKKHPELINISMEELEALIASGHNYHFVGKAGAFTPIKEGAGGGKLLRKSDNTYYSATGAKDYRWLESEMVLALNKEKDIDMSYYELLASNAKKDINNFGDFDWFASEQPYDINDNWILPF